MAVGNIENRLIDVFTPAVASSDLQIRTRTGGQPTEVPPRSPAQISGQKEVSDVINGSETSAGRARAMMHKFAVAPACLIDNVGRRAIGIALRPQHFKGDVLGMNRCHGRRRRATRGGHGGARLSLSSLLRRCAGRADGVLSLTSIPPGERAQGGKCQITSNYYTSAGPQKSLEQAGLSDVAPAGTHEFERRPAKSGRRAPVGHFGAADAELRTKPPAAGPKSEQPTENGPVATSTRRVQFEQNHSLMSCGASSKPPSSVHSGRRQQGPSCSAECPLYTPTGPLGGSVRGLRRPQTTIDASSVFGLSAPMCSRPSHEQFFLSHVSLLQAADVAGNRLSRNRAQTPPRERDRLGGVSARFAIMSSVETAATGFNDSVGRSVALLAIVR
ncbi:hypothetical protein THAOC_14597 [Thalassiosira oceanica]|uniref:DUF6820 domain-containing protein n=1 Tax=Thalassiosira oceanica TaxID=159749 RepID=K0T2L2_THAOC|nr:hypothetical protein THAOC_14597 [Thalassiosira oceanica]|eukprot:EJK64647.1 hypothetical protein THAOC_14597 [Thalassiosira oceanica]